MFSRRKLIETAGAMLALGAVTGRVTAPDTEPDAVGFVNLPPAISASVTLLTQNTTSTLGLFNTTIYQVGVANMVDIPGNQFVCRLRGIYSIQAYQEFQLANQNTRMGITAAGSLIAGNVGASNAAIVTDYVGVAGTALLNPGDTVSFPLLFAVASPSGPGKASMTLVERV